MNSAQQIKQQVKQSGQQMAAEPLEFLRSARAQVVGQEYENPEDLEYQNQKQKLQEEHDLKQKVDGEDRRHLEALQNEMVDIRRQKIFDLLLQRIQSGEDVSVEEFQELSHEQRDVLKAHLESVKANSQQSKAESQLVEPVAKRGRRLLGQKQSAQKQTTRVERPNPPSG